MDKLESGSGAPIYYHKDDDSKEFEFPSGESLIEEITKHIELHIGEIDMVFHELVSDQVHIDVHWLKPTKTMPFHTFVTSGMSDKPMNTPKSVEDNQFAELSICLPEEWEISEDSFKNDNNYWPIRWLKYLARFPHEYNTWLGYGHTIPNGNPTVPFTDNTKLNTMVLLPTIIFKEDFHTLTLKTKTINFYTLIPLYQEEVNLKMEKGVEALFDKFDKFGINDILNIHRQNTCKRKKLFGLF